jgi:hypothetical protein
MRQTRLNRTSGADFRFPTAKIPEWVVRCQQKTDDELWNCLFGVRQFCQLAPGTKPRHGCRGLKSRRSTTPQPRSQHSGQSVCEKSGWGTWIRTKTARVRVGSSTVKLSPNTPTDRRGGLACEATLPRRAPHLPFPFAACNPPLAESACPRDRIPGSCPFGAVQNCQPQGTPLAQDDAG